MTDDARTPGEGGSPRAPGEQDEYDPWAPPERRMSLEKPPPGPAYGGSPAGATLPNMPTMPTMPGFGPPGGPPAPPGAPGPVGPGIPVGPGAQGDPLPPPPPAPAPPPGGYVYPGAAGPAAAPPPAYGHPGAYAGYGYGWQGYPGMQMNGLGTASMVLGILSLCLFWLYGIVSLVLGILALVLGVKGRGRAERGEATNPGQALAGFVMGIIGMVVGVIVMILIGVATSAAEDYEDEHGYDDGYGYSAGALSRAVVPSDILLPPGSTTSATLSGPVGSGLSRPGC